jgi:septum formation protein
MNNILQQLPYQLILGSQSPRRQALLSGLDVAFTVMVKNTDESFPSDITPKEICEYLCQKKGRAFETELSEHPDWLIITADTIVSIGNEILNKPENEEEAKLMLHKLSGKKHTVFTGVCMKTQAKEIVFSSATQVYFGELTNEEMEYYIHTYRPFDKAGSYGVQEWIGYIAIEKIEGCYYNVMGLPVKEVYERLKSFIQ